MAEPVSKRLFTLADALAYLAGRGITKPPKELYDLAIEVERLEARCEQMALDIQALKAKPAISGN